MKSRLSDLKDGDSGVITSIEIGHRGRHGGNQEQEEAGDSKKG